MTDTQLRALVSYFTGKYVAKHSIGLQIGGADKTEAQEYFAAREALGIHGYEETEAAITRLRATLWSVG